MATITLNFPNHINISAQVGDTAYYVPTATSSDFTVNSSNVTRIGVITQINDVINFIKCDTLLPATDWPSANDFIFFSKDNKANMTSLLGYYAEVSFHNNSKKPAELYSIGSNVSISS